MFNKKMILVETLQVFIGYEIKANSDKIFSVIINCSTMYKGAAHPNTYAYGLSFDEQGNLIQFSQVINIDKQKWKKYLYNR